MVKRKSNQETQIIRLNESRWQPEDDLKLQTAIEQVNEISTAVNEFWYLIKA